jgi:hypothetical protein
MLREILLNEIGMKFLEPQVGKWNRIGVFASSEKLKSTPGSAETTEEPTLPSETSTGTFRLKKQRKVKVVAMDVQKIRVRMFPYNQLEGEKFISDLTGSNETLMAVYMDDYSCEPYLQHRSLVGQRGGPSYPGSHGTRDITALKDADFAAMFSSV